MFDEVNLAGLHPRADGGKQLVKQVEKVTGTQLLEAFSPIHLAYSLHQWKNRMSYT